MKKYLVGGFGSVLMTVLSFALVLQATASHAIVHQGIGNQKASVIESSVIARK